MTSKAYAKMEQAQENRLMTQQFNHRVMKRWLQGYSIGDIAYSEGGIEAKIVMQAIELQRVELAEAQEADIKHLVAERIAGLRVIKQEAHEYLDFMPEKASQLLTVSLRAEEVIAKLQGVLSEKVMHMGRIQHDIKMYDFDDKTPNPLIIDVVAKTVVPLMEPELAPLETVIDIDMGQMKDMDKPAPVIPVETSTIPVPPRKVVNGVQILRAGDMVV